MVARYFDGKVSGVTRFGLFVTLSESGGDGLVPVSSLSGVARVMGLAFPAAWYQPISIGVFAKGLGFADLWSYIVVLMLFGVGFIAAATLALRKQGA